MPVSITPTETSEISAIVALTGLAAQDFDVVAQLEFRHTIAGPLSVCATTSAWGSTSRQCYEDDVTITAYKDTPHLRRSFLTVTFKVQVRKADQNVGLYQLENYIASPNLKKDLQAKRGSISKVSGTVVVAKPSSPAEVGHTSQTWATSSVVISMVVMAGLICVAAMYFIYLVVRPREESVMVHDNLTVVEMNFPGIVPAPLLGSVGVLPSIILEGDAANGASEPYNIVQSGHCPGAVTGFPGDQRAGAINDASNEVVTGVVVDNIMTFHNSVMPPSYQNAVQHESVLDGTNKT